MRMAGLTALKVRVEQHEDQEQRQRHDEHQPTGRPLQVLELPAVLDVVAGRQFHPFAATARCTSAMKLPRSRPRTFGLDADLAVDVLAADLRRPLLEDDVGQLRQRDHATARIGDLDVPDRLDAVADGRR